jgi:hypothetical protein
MILDTSHWFFLRFTYRGLDSLANLFENGFSVRAELVADAPAVFDERQFKLARFSTHDVREQAHLT